jgi:hypothetical protein
MPVLAHAAIAEAMPLSASFRPHVPGLEAHLHPSSYLLL